MNLYDQVAALKQERDLHATARTNLEEQRRVWEEEKQELSTRAAELSSQVPHGHLHTDMHKHIDGRKHAHTRNQMHVPVHIHVASLSRSTDKIHAYSQTQPCTCSHTRRLAEQVVRMAVEKDKITESVREHVPPRDQSRIRFTF